MLTKQQLYETSTEELNEYKELKAGNSLRAAAQNELERRKYVDRWNSHIQQLRLLPWGMGQDYYSDLSVRIRNITEDLKEAVESISKSDEGMFSETKASRDLRK